MVDIHSILADHKSCEKIDSNGTLDDEPLASEIDFKLTSSDIPDLFFDTILVNYKLSRNETLILMFLYRIVWCRPNLYKEYGISPLISHTELSKLLKLDIQEIYVGIRRLEHFEFLSTIRSGQYFVRKFFLKAFDDKLNQMYDDFNT